MRTPLARVGCALALVLWWSLSGAAQSPTASLAGAVTDPGRAPLPDARVEARHLAREQVFEAFTDAHGRFRFPFLPVGAYRITITRAGFMPLIRDVELAVGESLEMPISLAIAGIQETVSVTAAAETVELTRTAVSERVTPREIDNLPLNGRNYLDLALLTPAVSRTVTRNTERFAETSAVPGTGISVAGQRNLNNTFLVDGLSANDDAAGLAGRIAPASEAFPPRTSRVSKQRSIQRIIEVLARARARSPLGSMRQTCFCEPIIASRQRTCSLAAIASTTSTATTHATWVGSTT
jgi:hypothetical protein